MTTIELLPRFVTLHRRDSGEPCMFNTAAIHAVARDGAGAKLIFGHTYEGRTLSEPVRESLEDIMTMLNGTHSDVLYK